MTTKNTMILISIVIPIYRVEDYLIDCLHSVANQTLREGLECILVDDCGGDNSIRLAQKFFDSYEGNIQFHIISHEKNRGAAAARNTGLDAAQGKYIYFLDADDQITPNGLQLLLEKALSTQADVTIADFTTIGLSDPFIHLALEDGQILHDKEVLHAYALQSWMGVCWNMLYLREYLQRENLRFVEGLHYEDELWATEIACTAHALVAIKEPTYLYHLRQDSTSSLLRGQQDISSYYQIMLGMAEHFQRQGLIFDIDACLKYYSMQYTFLLTLLQSEPAAPYLAYQHMVSISPFGKKIFLRTLSANKRRMFPQIYAILPKPLGYLMLRLQHKLRTLIR